MIHSLSLTHKKTARTCKSERSTHVTQDRTYCILHKQVYPESSICQGLGGAYSRYHCLKNSSAVSSQYFGAKQAGPLARRPTIRRRGSRLCSSLPRFIERYRPLDVENQSRYTRSNLSRRQNKNDLDHRSNRVRGAGPAASIAGGRVA